LLGGTGYPIRDRGVGLGLAERTADLAQYVLYRVECWKVRRLAPGLPVKRMQHAEHERDQSARELLPKHFACNSLYWFVWFSLPFRPNARLHRSCCRLRVSMEPFLQNEHSLPSRHRVNRHADRQRPAVWKSAWRGGACCCRTPDAPSVACFEPYFAGREAPVILREPYVCGSRYPQSFTVWSIRPPCPRFGPTGDKR